MRSDLQIWLEKDPEKLYFTTMPFESQGTNYLTFKVGNGDSRLELVFQSTEMIDKFLLRLMEAKVQMMQEIALTASKQATLSTDGETNELEI